MRIAIDALSARTGGGLTYIVNLVPNLLKVGPQHLYWLFVSHNCLPLLKLEAPSLTVVPVNIARPVLLRRLFYQQVVMPVVLRRNRIDLLYSSADLACLFPPCPVVLANQNLNPFNNIYPKISPTYWKLRLIRILSRLSTYKARRIIFVSDHARQVVSQQFGIPAGKGVTVHHGIGPQFSLEAKDSSHDGKADLLNGAKRYILSVSNVYKHKNFVRLIEAFALISQRIAGDYVLVIAGEPLEADYYAQMRRRAVECGVADRVRLTNGVPYDRMPSLYGGADLFVFPSYVETFGLPLVEAMASGLPVVASRASCIPEICQDAALYFDPFSVDDMAEKMMQALQDQELRKTLRERAVARARDFSWEKTAQRVLEVFENAVSQQVRGSSVTKPSSGR